jgi:hypothetical protein
MRTVTESKENNMAYISVIKNIAITKWQTITLEQEYEVMHHRASTIRQADLDDIKDALYKSSNHPYSSLGQMVKEALGERILCFEVIDVRLDKPRRSSIGPHLSLVNVTIDLKVKTRKKL